jgi:hypothetical protein
VIIAYDCEFIEDGSTIGLISIGMAADDGREYYAVNSDISFGSEQSDALRKRISGHDWLMQNVIPHLPLTSAPHRSDNTWIWSLDRSSLLVKPRWVIANEVRDFIASTADPELWAWYAAYDHVALAQLWGPMIRLPNGVPMWTNDLKQEVQRLGNPELPPMPGVTEHNALSDAREVLHRLRWLRSEHAPTREDQP